MIQNDKYKTILLLHEKMVQDGVQHEFRELHDGFQIRSIDYLWDIVEHKLSQGSENDKVEVAGILRENVTLFFEGNLSFDDIVTRLKSKRILK